MSIKFLKKGIRFDGQYTPVFYSQGNYTPESKLPKKTITVYSRDYGKRLPSALSPINQSDGMTDYFEKDRARILPGSKYYKQALKQYRSK